MGLHGGLTEEPVGRQADGRGSSPPAQPAGRAQACGPATSGRGSGRGAGHGAGRGAAATGTGRSGRHHRAAATRSPTVSPITPAAPSTSPV